MSSLFDEGDLLRPDLEPFNINPDILAKASNDYESLTRRQEELGYKHGWVFYKLREKYGEEIAKEVYESDRYDGLTSGDGWEGDEGD